MKNIIRTLSFVVVGFTLLSQQTFAAGDARAGAAKATTCLACHGETGNSPAGAYPNIAGQNEQYLLKQLIDIKNGTRPVPTMVGQLDAYSAEDLADIAAHYAGQKRAYGAAKADQVDLGEAIYRFGIPRKHVAACSACHSPTGSGNGPARFPALAGQWPEYTIAQLKAFQSGKRHNDGDGEMMQTTSMDMNEKEMTAVASYIYGLK